MTDRPIIFSGPMVRALLDGRKTQTRRLVYGRRRVKDGERVPEHSVLRGDGPDGRFVYDPAGTLFPDPAGTYWRLTGWHECKPGDRLWVRENLAAMSNWGLWHGAGPVPATGQFLDDRDDRGKAMLERYAPAEPTDSARVPSIHMPRWASRLTLIVTDTKIERLQEISERDAVAEGLINKGDHTWPLWTAGDGFKEHFEFPAGAFRELWEHLNGPASWDENPEVVALTFTVHAQNINARAAA